MDFNGKTFIVTGGASGIGKAVVQKLLSLSASVHIIDLSTTAPEVDSEHTARLHFHPSVDVTSREQISRVFESIIQQSPDIHGLVNCAGVAPPKKDDTCLPEPDEQFHRVMGVNVTGTWNASTAYFWHLLKKYPELATNIKELEPREGLGSVVNISSIAAFLNEPGLGSYNASKNAIIGLTKTWAKEYIRRGVRVNCIAPGVVDTPMTSDGTVAPAIIDRFLKGTPMGRMGRPEELANAILFLLSDQASFIAGQVLPVDGSVI